jgi:hypothetical protein
MKTKRILSEKEKTTLAVDRETLLLVKAYARKKGLTVAEATFWLIGRGLAAEYGMEWVRKDEQSDRERPNGSNT